MERRRVLYFRKRQANAILHQNSRRVNIEDDMFTFQASYLFIFFHGCLSVGLAVMHRRAAQHSF